MEDNLIVTNKTRFVIYGGGEVGNLCCRRLRKNGYCVAAAIDRNRSGQGIIGGINTYRPDEFFYVFDQIDELVIVICLADGQAHRDVADTLYRRGIKYIVFLPLDYCMKDSEKTRLTRIYNKVLDGMTEHSPILIKSYKNYYTQDLDVNNSVLATAKEYYTVWLGMELLFTENLKLWEGDISKIHGKDTIKDKSIANNDPHELIFQFFDSKTEDCEWYFNSYKGEKSVEQKKNELEKREKLYRLFKREHNKGMRFFIDGAPHVVWNPRNYFNLVGGHHRTMYLLSEGHTVFPVVVSKKDFTKWCNNEIYEKFVSYLKTHQIESLYAPLPHPGMLNFPVECESFGETKLKCIINFLSHEDVSSMEILDCSRGQGYYARNMERIGVKKAVYANSNLINVELADLMNRLLYRDQVVVRLTEIKNIPIEEAYDIVFALDQIHVDVNYRESEDWKVIEKITRKYLVLEFYENEEDHIIENSSFEGFIPLHSEYRLGNIWKTLIFYKT